MLHIASCVTSCPEVTPCQLPSPWPPIDPALNTGPAKPTVTALVPNTAEIGTPPLVMKVQGTNFTPNSEILWNGVPEPTTYVSATELTTVVKPETATGAFTIPVSVRTQWVNADAGQNFSFTEPAPPLVATRR